MTYQDLLENLNPSDRRIARLAWNTANTNTINAITAIALRHIGSLKNDTAQCLIDLITELEPVLNYKDKE